MQEFCVCLLLFNFNYYRVTQFLVKKELDIFWGIPPPGPLEFSRFQNFMNDHTYRILESLNAINSIEIRMFAKN